ncbi:MAG TPA: cytochrome b/b6 domain-containing protein [Anaerolineales bacterium]|nr:cytochrome b/b6 domain-containing protein [Anaerolineales bacterium]
MRSKLLLSLSLLIVLAAVFVVGQTAAHNASRPIAQTSPLHPTFPLLDAGGDNVLKTSEPVSTMQTCGECHDTEFIAGHSFHSDLGLSDSTQPGHTASGRSWDTSPGLFGKWNPLTYRYLSPAGDERIDLTTADWVRLNADRLVGGGPAVTSRNGGSLTELTPQATDPETASFDPIAKALVAWDWQKSGVLEMNCFLCHFAEPNNTARIAAIQSGDFKWASTATLLGTGLVEKTADGWQWNQSAFDENGDIGREFLAIQDPVNENCAQCHGVVHADVKAPLILAGCTWETATTGQVFTSQTISNSGMNIAAKDDVTRSWDIHAERELKCTDCHYSLNNPAYYQADSGPEHLSFDPRRLEIGEYLQKPVHQFARGQSAQFTVAPELKGTMRRCESCHTAETAHDWLPYAKQHMAEVACESCHIPQMYAPAIQQYDWTVIRMDGGPKKECRGIDTTSTAFMVSASANPVVPATVSNLVTGFEPVLLTRRNVDGNTMLAPYNLITAWYWVYDDTNGNTRPVRLQDLQAVWLQNGEYAAEIVKAFNANGDQQLSNTELMIDTTEKQTLIVNRLESLGLHNPRIVGEVQPYSINHNVARGEWATKDCQTCHNDESRITQPMKLADYMPGGVTPAFVKDANTITNGDFYTDGGALYYRPATSDQNVYVFGHSRVSWIDWFGVAALLGVIVGVTTHGGLRFYASLRAPRHTIPTKRVYMYAVYERFWHWLQTFTILLLLVTGLIIHRPDLFGFFNFKYVVVVHNVVAAILVINAALSLFYHLASGEIRQYLPRPYGFFDQAIVQAKFYLRGLFKGEPHPFEKTPQKKLNPLQQITYFGILNVLLPLQVITGALMWSVQEWPQIAGALGGLPFLAPFHSLVAWTFAAFIIAHVYLTTTGHQPLANMQAMMIGWDEVEDHTALTETLIAPQLDSREGSSSVAAQSISPQEEVVTHDIPDTPVSQKTEL